MANKHVSIATEGGFITLHGEPLFDADEKTLVVQGPEGTYAVFNWSRIDFFTVQPCDDDEDE